MYSQADLSEIFEKLKETVSTNMDSEMSYYINMNGKRIFFIF